MARYADRECEDCGIVLPADQMTRLDEKTPTWVGSNSVRYKFSKIDLCSSCVTKRAENVEKALAAEEEKLIAAEREFKIQNTLRYVKRIIGTCFVIALLIFITFLGMKNIRFSDNQDNLTTNAVSSETGQNETVGNDSDSSAGGSAKGDGDYIATAEVAIKDQARDPGSVAFANERVVRHGDGSVNVCGKVNGANGFGGKTGFQDFVWGTPTSHVAGLTMYDPKNLGPTLSAWGEGCLPIGPGDKGAPPSQAGAASAVPAAPTPQITAPATPEPPLTSDDRSLPQVVHDADRLDEACRGGQTNLDVICSERDGAFEKARAEGWCFGDDQTTNADAIWHRCGETNATASIRMNAQARRLGWCPGGIASADTDGRWHRCAASN